MKMTRQKNRIQSIDTMRGIAALIVVYCHFLPVTPVGNGSSLTALLDLLREQIFQRGQLGVALFFIISGYVVPFSLIGAREGGIGKFIISRFMRLYPAYWLSLIAGLWLVGRDTGPLTIIANITMAQRFMGVQDVLGVYWTLSVELVFYFLIAVGFIAGLIQEPRRLKWITLGLIFTTMAFAAGRRFFDMPLPAGNLIFLCLMFGGAWLRLGVYRSRDLWWIVTAYLLALLAICWLLYYPAKFGSPWFLQFSRYLYAVLLFFAILYWRAGRAAFLAYLGRISYSIYLLHVPANALVAIILPTLGLAVGGWLMFAVSLLLTLGVSALTFKYLELPFIRMGKNVQAYYTRRLAGRTVNETAS